MQNSIKIAPSILSADFSRLAEALQMVENAADLIHLDIMDGHYVPNLTIGAPIIASLRKETELFLEAHLMISNPDEMLESFVKAGVNRIIIHPETTLHLHRTCHRILEMGVEVGLAINPAQNLDLLSLEYVGDILSTITIMSVNPGFPAQKFIPSAILKIQNLKKKLLNLNLSKIQIEVDGGVNQHNIQTLVEAGAEIFIAGNAVYGTKNPSEAIQNLRNKASNLI